MAYQTRYNKKGEKLYPFNMLKNGHNIELAYNRQYIICEEMKDGERAWNDEAFEYFDKLSEVYACAMGHPVFWATGKQYGILKEASAWAVCYRDRKNA